MSVEEAYGMGLVNQMVPKDKRLGTAEALAGRIVFFNPTAVRNAKEAVTRGLDLSLSEGLELERRLASGLRRQGEETR